VRKQSGTVTVVGGAGVTVSKRVAEDGTHEIAVTMGDDSDTAALARAYQAAGRSVLDDARAAGVSRGMIRHLCEKALANGQLKLVATSGSGTVFNSSCVHDSVGYVEWDGCVTRYRATNDGDPNWNYGIDDAQAHGHETNWEPWLDLHAGGVKNSYSTSRVDITKAAPGSDLPDVNQCYNQTFGASAGGFGLTSGGTICPDRWNITWPGLTSGTEYHKVQWEGESNSDREADALTAYRYQAGYSSAYTLSINWDVH
jgi:hypothetical protein